MFTALILQILYVVKIQLKVIVICLQQILLTNEISMILKVVFDILCYLFDLYLLFNFDFRCRQLSIHTDTRIRLNVRLIQKYAFIC